MGVKAVADCHQAGLWQNDIHLDNFMLCAGIVYVLDGADIKSEGGVLDIDTRLANFAMFLAQFPVSQDKHWRDLFDQYCKQAPGLTTGDTADFAGKIIKARRKRLNCLRAKAYPVHQRKSLRAGRKLISTSTIGRYTHLSLIALLRTPIVSSMSSSC